jgi:hypothetical protein
MKSIEVFKMELIGFPAKYLFVNSEEERTKNSCRFRRGRREKTANKESIYKTLLKKNEFFISHACHVTHLSSERRCTSKNI